jgi:hypothetical protein
VGSDDVGSAIAHALHDSGAAVVLVDAADPPWSRRGMSYVDAWYVGGATLDGVDACFCASVKSIPAVLARGDMIAATTWSWAGVATALQPAALVVVRFTGARPPFIPPSPALDALPTIRVRPRASGTEVVAVTGPQRYPGGGVDFLRDIGGAAFATLAPDLRVDAPRAGRFRTRHEIAERVEAGDVLGALDGYAVAAPASGVLRALCARGARVAAGQTLVEIDRSGDAQACFGVQEPARAVAERVCVVVRNALARSASAERVMAG